MTPKEYLNQCRVLESRTQELQAEYQAIKSTLLSAVDYSNEPVTSCAKNSSDNIYIKLLERNEEINRTIDKLVNVKIKVSSELDAMAEDTLRRVLRDRYISNKSFEEIAVDMGYTIRRVYQLHGQALLEFEKLYPQHFI